MSWLAASVLAQSAVDCADSRSEPVCAFLIGVLPERLDWTAGPGGAALAGALRILLILALAFVANRLLRRAVERFVGGLSPQGLARLGALRRDRMARAERGNGRTPMRTETAGAVLRSVSTAVVYTTAFVLILDQVGVAVGPLIAGAGVAGVALGFGAQSLVKDFLSGIFILMEDQYGVGDIVDLGEGQTPVAGTVESVTLRVTRIRDVVGTVWYVPNGEIRAVGNKSHQWARSLIDVSVAYETDIVQAQAVIKRVADGVWKEEPWASMILEPPEVWGVESLGPSEVVIRLVVKTEPAQQFKVNRELRLRLKEALQDEGIEIAVPQTVVIERAAEDHE